MWSYLNSVSSEVEADIVEGLLQEAQISVQKKFPGSGNLKGSYGIVNGVELWVQSIYLEQAREILDSLTHDLEDKTLQKSTSIPKSTFLRKAVLLSFFLVLFVLLYWLFKGLDSF